MWKLKISVLRNVYLFVCLSPPQWNAMASIYISVAVLLVLLLPWYQQQQQWRPLIATAGIQKAECCKCNSSLSLLLLQRSQLLHAVIRSGSFSLQRSCKVILNLHIHGMQCRSVIISEVFISWGVERWDDIVAADVRCGRWCGSWWCRWLAITIM